MRITPAKDNAREPLRKVSGAEEKLYDKRGGKTKKHEGKIFKGGGRTQWACGDTMSKGKKRD